MAHGPAPNRENRGCNDDLAVIWLIWTRSLDPEDISDRPWHLLPLTILLWQSVAYTIPTAIETGRQDMVPAAQRE